MKSTSMAVRVVAILLVVSAWTLSPAFGARIVAWGDNAHGQCNVPKLGNFVGIGAGYRHSFALRSSGTLAAWGWNYYGQATSL